MSDTILNSFRSRDSYGGSGRRDLAGLSLDDILAGSREPEPPKKKDPEPPKRKDPEPPKKPVLQYSTSHITRTLLDVIREEEPNSGGSYAQHGGDNNKAWKSFKDRLRHRGTNQTWTASQPVPTSDEPIKTYRSRKNLNRSDSEMTDGDDESKPEEGQVSDVPTRASKPVMMRRGSVRFNPDAVEPDDPVGPVLKPSFSRRESARLNSRTGSSRYLARSESVAQRDDDLLSVDERHLGRRGSSLRGGEERPMSAREAAASQEAAEAEAAASAAAAEAAAAAAAKEAEEAEPGFVKKQVDEDRKEDEWGAAAAAAEEEKEPAAMFSLMDLLEQTDKQMGWEGSRYMDEDDEDYEEEEDEEEDEYSGHESNCSICMVKHREAPLAPCGHGYCKMCSRELYVSRSNCPVCNDFIEEIIDVF